jgi:hypothetical protein
MSEYRCPICGQTFTDINIAVADIRIHDSKIRSVLMNFTKDELADMVLNNMTTLEKKDYLTKLAK